MAHNAAERITDYLQDRVGGGLRTVVIVGEDGWEVCHLRRDLREEYTEETYDEVVGTFRLEHPFLAPETESRPVGKRHAIVHYHEHAFVVQFPLSETESILVSLTPETGRNLLRFIENCRRLI